MCGELRADLGGEGLDLFDQGPQHGDECVGDVGLGLCVGAERAAGCGGQLGAQDGGGGAA